MKPTIFLKRFLPNAHGRCLVSRGARLGSLLAVCLALTPALFAASPPNIILILADDQGWNGLSVPMDPDVPESRSDYYQTPNLDALALGGMRFSRGYSPASVCSPTRHSIQFGVSPAKLRVTDNSGGTQRQHCDPADSLPNLIKKADPRYATAHFGKWHVSFSPEECGYDESDGWTTNREGDDSPNPNDPKRTYEVTDRAVDFLERQARDGQPVFLQVSYYAVHLAFKSSPEMLEKYQRLQPGERHGDSEFAGMNEDLDAGVGQILDAVDRLGIADNTYIIYTADNGFDESHLKLDGEPRRKAWPLSYSKGFVFEGGIRVPFIVRGPGIEAGAFSDVPVVGYDLLPTILDWIAPGFPFPDVIEGGSLTPILQNKGKVKRPADFLLFHYPTGVWPSQTSLIQGDFKLVKTWAFDRVELFNLKDDPSESRDLSAEVPEKARELHEAMNAYLSNVHATLPPEAELEIDRSGVLMKRAHKNPQH